VSGRHGYTPTATGGGCAFSRHVGWLLPAKFYLSLSAEPQLLMINVVLENENGYALMV
jgi:hypothetical protein